jgi:hypothetical protein
MYVILISKDNSNWYKSWPYELGQEKFVGHMKSKEKRWEIMVFLIQFIIIGCFDVNVRVNWMKFAW